MALIDDIEFYGRAVDAGEMTRPDAARALAEASGGGLTLVGAERAINDWKGMRERLEGQHADTVDSIRALRNGKPIPGTRTAAHGRGEQTTDAPPRLTRRTPEGPPRRRSGASPLRAPLGCHHPMPASVPSDHDQPH